MWVTFFRYTSFMGSMLAMAAFPGAAGAGSIRYDCDTAAKVFSEINFTQLGPNYRISGSVSSEMDRNTSEWIPVASVRLISADKKNFGGIRLEVPVRKGPVELLVQTKSGASQNNAVVGMLQKSELAPFSIDVVDGKMKISAGGRTFAVDPKIGTGGAVQISCSSGRFLFENLDWDVPTASR